MSLLRESSELGRSLREVPAARARVDHILESFGCAGANEVASLLASELISNAIRHGNGHITLVVECIDSATVRVTVHDEGGGEPRVHRPDPLDPRGGRGLLIVDALSSGWGVDYGGAGKSVWFEVPVEDAQPRG